MLENERVAVGLVRCALLAVGVSHCALAVADTLLPSVGGEVALQVAGIAEVGAEHCGKVATLGSAFGGGVHGCKYVGEFNGHSLYIDWLVGLSV
jgi:hypothetical protein